MSEVEREFGVLDAGNIGFPSPDPRMVLEVLSLETAQPEPGT